MKPTVFFCLCYNSPMSPGSILHRSNIDILSKIISLTGWPTDRVAAHQSVVCRWHAHPWAAAGPQYWWRHTPRGQGARHSYVSTVELAWANTTNSGACLLQNSFSCSSCWPPKRSQCVDVWWRYGELLLELDGFAVSLLQIFGLFSI